MIYVRFKIALAYHPLQLYAKQCHLQIHNNSIRTKNFPIVYFGILFFVWNCSVLVDGAFTYEKYDGIILFLQIPFKSDKSYEINIAQTYISTGIYYTMTIIGPAVGYVVGGQLLLLYTDFLTVDPLT